MIIKTNSAIIDADGYTPIREENSVRFYRNKSDLDYIPLIKVDADILSEFGKKVLGILRESEE